MRKIGLVAGAGTLPLEFIRAVKARGETIIVFALEGMASPEIEGLADRTYRVKAGKFLSYVFPLIFGGIRRIAFLGKVDKNIIYDKKQYDAGSKMLFNRIPDTKDTTILAAITGLLRIIGVQVMDTREYFSHLMPAKGVIGEIAPDKSIMCDMEFGFEAAKKLSKMDIGQTVIVKNRSIVAVEAMEGTDAAIARGSELAGDGCVMVKVSRPDQDYRWDVPTVGLRTLKKLVKYGYKGLAMESGRMYLLEKEALVKLADDNGIAVIGM